MKILVTAGACLLAVLVFTLVSYAESCVATPVRGNAIRPSYGYNHARTDILVVPVAPDYYYSVGDDEEREERIAERIARKIGEKAPQAAPAAHQAPQAAHRAGREMFSLGGGGGAKAGLDDRVLAVFNESCIKCHKPGAAKPGVQLFTFDRKLFVDPDPRKEARRRDKVYEAVESGEMPKGAGPLAASAKALLLEWSQQSSQ